jgi:hypothetical protein
VEDVYRLVVLLSQHSLKNYRTLFSIVTLLGLTLDVNDESLKKVINTSAIRILFITATFSNLFYIIVYIGGNEKNFTSH